MKIKYIISFLLCLGLFMATTSFSQPTTWEQNGIGGGGSLFSPLINPYDHNEMFIACDMTQMFHTTDAGKTWDILHYQNLIATIQTSIQFTSDPNILYAIHLDFKPDLRVPVRSDDGGKTWKAITDPTEGQSYFLFANPNNTNELILSDWCDVYYSDDGGSSFVSIYYDCTYTIWMAGVHWDDENIYIGLNSGLLVSKDGGKNFSLSNIGGLPAGKGFLSFAGATENGKTRLMGILMYSGDLWSDMGLYDVWGYNPVYKLDIGIDDKWKQTGNTIPQTEHFIRITMAKENIDIAYVGGTNENTAFPVIYKTENGGGSWQSVLDTEDNGNIATGWCGNGGDKEWYYAEKTFGLAVATNDPEKIIFTDYGFAHLSTNGGESWKQLYQIESNSNPAGSETPTGLHYKSNGLENTSTWWLTWSDENNLWASYTDMAAVRSEDNGQTWSFDYGNYNEGEIEGNTYNSTYCTVRDPNTGRLYAAVSTVHDIYQSTYLFDQPINSGDGAILMSDDKGKSWTLMKDFDNPVVWLEMDANEPNTLIASVVNSQNGAIYKTGNATFGTNATWTKLNGPPNTKGHPLSVKILKDGTLVCIYSGNRNNNGDFLPTSGCFVLPPGATNWENRSHPNMKYWTKDLTIDPHDPNQNTWYAGVFEAWGKSDSKNTGGLYRTKDRGITWTKISDVFRVEAIAIHPDKPNIAYMTSEADGLLYTDNLNDDMPIFKVLEEYPFQHPLRVFFNPYDHNEIWVTSFGNGLRKGTTDIIDNIDIKKQNSFETKIRLDYDPEQDRLKINLPKENGIANIRILNLQGQILMSKSIHQVNEITLSTQPFDNGLFFVQCMDEYGNIMNSEKVMLIR